MAYFGVASKTALGMPASFSLSFFLSMMKRVMVCCAASMAALLSDCFFCAFLPKKYITTKRTVKTRLVLEKILVQEKIEVTDKDLEDKFNEHNKEKPKSISEIKKTLNPEQLNYFENSILLNKLMAFLKENNNM